MSVPFWKSREAKTDNSNPGALAVDESHALPVGIYYAGNGSDDPEVVNDGHPLPVAVQNAAPDSPSYRAAFSLAAVSGDAVVVFGNSARKIRVLEIGIAKPTVGQTVLINKRSTNTTGGTSTTTTNVAGDISSPPSGTTIRIYTAAGTAGTLAGTIARCVVATSDVLIFDFRSEPVIMRTADECLAVNVDATGTLPGWLVWNEEDL